MVIGSENIRKSGPSGTSANWLTRLVAAGLLPFWLSCGVPENPNPEDTKEPKPSTAPKLVGRIATIPPGKQFVLIQSYGSWTIQPGTILTTRGPDSRTANLRVTGESNGQFAAADLQSGTLEVGDAVYSRHTPKPPDALPSPELPVEALGNQQSAESENVQKNN
jgi:hypothetical protein